MKRMPTFSLIGAFLVAVLLVAVVTVGCGTASQSAAQAQAGPTTPQGILQQALANTGQATGGTGDINMSLTITGDQTKMPGGAGALLGQPIKLSGTYSFDKTAKAVQASLNAAIAGQSLPVGFEAVNGQAWLQFMGQWYQTPASTDKAGDTTTTGQVSNAASIQQALTAAGVDPSTWLTDLKLVGEETIKGSATSHLSATVNMSQIASDLPKLAASGALKGLIPSGAESTQSTAPGSSTSESMPTQQELQQLESSLPSVVQSLMLDIWVTKDTHQIRQLEVKASIVPPAESAQSESTTSESTATTESPAQAATKAALQGLVQGIKSVSLDATVSLTPATAPLKVTPPTDAKPWGDLQTTLQGYMSMFSGVLGGGSTSTSAQ
jgi:hypothetical protein